MILPILKGETPTRRSVYQKAHLIVILIMSFIYLFECKQCQYRFPYVGSTKTKFRYRINNYKSTHRKFSKKYAEKDLAIVIKKSKLKQKLFHEQYCSQVHQEIENWSVTLTDQVEDLDLLRKKDLYWIKRLNTYAPNGLDVREVYEGYN